MSCCGLTHVDILLVVSCSGCQVMEDPAPVLPPGYSEEFQSFINDCLEKDPAVRQTAEQVRWNQSCDSVGMDLQSMLQRRGRA